MSIVNFSIPQTLEKRVATAVKEKGFPSKAELFRFAVIRYLDENFNSPLAHDKEIAHLSKRLEELLNKKFSSKKLPSVEKQMKRVYSL